MEERLHAPMRLLRESVDPVALVILNQPLPSHAFRELWDRATVRVCADGGANRLFDECPDRDEFLPEAVVGDLDSVRPDVREFYESKGVEVVHVEEQDSTDLVKCLRYIIDNTPSHALFVEVSAVFILSSVMTRFDHAMANIQALFEFEDRVPDVYLIGAESCIWLLNKGNHRILLTEIEGPSCGLLPIGGPCKQVTTTGLRWNVDKAELRFGGLVSSSNAYLETARAEEEGVTVQTDAPLVWTTEYSIAGLEASMRDK